MSRWCRGSRTWALLAGVDGPLVAAQVQAPVFPAQSAKFHTPRRSTQVPGFGPLDCLTPTRRLLSACCSSSQYFACSFLQIPPRDGPPCCSATPFPLPGGSRAFTFKSSKSTPQRSRQRQSRRYATCLTHQKNAAGTGPTAFNNNKQVALPVDSYYFKSKL